jgi:hypothetical protein
MTTPPKKAAIYVRVSTATKVKAAADTPSATCGTARVECRPRLFRPGKRRQGEPGGAESSHG